MLDLHIPDCMYYESAPMLNRLVTDKKKIKFNAPPPALKLMSKLANVSGSTSTDSTSGEKTDTEKGVSSFAKLSAEISIKNSADAALNLLLSHPMMVSSHAFYHDSSAWNEFQTARSMWLHQRTMLGNSRPDDVPNVSDLKTLVKFFGYQNQFIFGFVEVPVWAAKTDILSNLGLCDSDVFKDVTSPCLIVIIREATGKHSRVEKLDVGTPRAPVESIRKERQTLERFVPHLYPHIPKNSRVVKLASHNESSIPKFSDLIPKGGKEEERYKRIVQLCERQSILDLELKERYKKRYVSLCLP